MRKEIKEQRKGCGKQEYLEVKGMKFKTERCGYYPKRVNKVYYCPECLNTQSKSKAKKQCDLCSTDNEATMIKDGYDLCEKHFDIANSEDKQ